MESFLFATDKSFSASRALKDCIMNLITDVTYSFCVSLYSPPVQSKIATAVWYGFTIARQTHRLPCYCSHTSAPTCSLDASRLNSPYEAFKEEINVLYIKQNILNLNRKNRLQAAIGTT